jgi:hypothetical protein
MAIAAVGVMGTAGNLIQHALAASVHCNTLSCPTETPPYKQSSPESTQNPQPTETIHFDFKKIEQGPN